MDTDKPEFRRWGARPPRALLAAPRDQHLAGGLPRTLGIISVRPGFPRGRGKPHPGRVRSFFYLGARKKQGFEKGGASPSVPPVLFQLARPFKTDGATRPAN